MILPRHDIAWVRCHDGRLQPFDEQRLARSIETAAADAGLPQAWLAESIASAIHRYTCQCLPHSTIDAAELAETVLAVLASLRYHEIAAAYGRQRHRVVVRLEQLACQNGGMLELEFFQSLDAVLRDATARPLALLQLHGLRACVMRLRRALRWSAGCRRLADEIVEHIRARLRTRTTGNLNLTLLH
jgi:hypothetical protein